MNSLSAAGPNEDKLHSKLVPLKNSELGTENLASTLKGNTLRVYWYLLRASDNVARTRETQRALGFSSSALAAYHLDKLVELGIVEKIRGEYHLARVVNVGILKQFVRLGTFVLPRYTFYATLLTTLLIFYLSQLRDINFYSVFALLFGMLATGILWYETIRIWQQKP